MFLVRCSIGHYYMKQLTFTLVHLRSSLIISSQIWHKKLVQMYWANMLLLTGSQWLVVLQICIYYGINRCKRTLL